MAGRIATFRSSRLAASRLRICGPGRRPPSAATVALLALLRALSLALFGA